MDRTDVFLKSTYASLWAFHAALPTEATWNTADELYLPPAIGSGCVRILMDHDNAGHIFKDKQIP
jgi:hypothetical protein